MTQRSDIDLKVLKKRLLERREELRSLSEGSEKATKPVVLDQTAVGRLSRMDDLQTQAMALETERRRASERTQVEAALVRIEDGDYGYCLNCDEEVAAKRLAHDPAAPLCIDCARQTTAQ